MKRIISVLLISLPVFLFGNTYYENYSYSGNGSMATPYATFEYVVESW